MTVSWTVPAVTPGEAHDFIASNAHQPGRERHLAPLVARQAGQHLVHDLFRYILRVMDVAETGEAVAVDLVDVGVVEGGKRLQITRLGGFDNAALGFPV